jgi:hypothetical protein
MRFYQALDGTIMDLNHVIAVRPSMEDTGWTSPDDRYCFKVECAFGTSIYLYGSEKEIGNIRNHLLNAWCPGKQ